MKKYLVSVPIVRKQFNKTKSAKFKGDLQFVSNEHGIIYDWRILFSEVYIDVFTTEKWFNELPATFKRRSELFKILNLKQEVRPSKTQTKIVKMNPEQINIINDFFNDRNSYDSTLKNVVGVLKGNNPGGEAKNPNSAEMIIDTNSSIRNFVILFDDLVMKNKNSFEAEVIGSEEIQINQFASLNLSLNSAFSYMQKSKDLSSWASYLAGIKKYYKQYNVDINKAYIIADRARSAYGKKIDQEISSFPFGFKTTDEFQKCHIYEFSDLRDMIVEAIRENKSYSKYEEMIKDTNNFLPLPEHVHRKFDRNYFTYKTNGEIWPIHEAGKKFVDSIDDKFKKIPDFFLTSKRIEYIAKRNKEINYID